LGTQIGRYGADSAALLVTSRDELVEFFLGLLDPLGCTLHRVLGVRGFLFGPLLRLAGTAEVDHRLLGVFELPGDLVLQVGQLCFSTRQPVDEIPDLIGLVLGLLPALLDFRVAGVRRRGWYS